VSICAASSWRCTRLRKLNQNCLANTQEARRWSIFSSSWSHSGQVSWWFIPRFANRSAVQHFLWATSQTKNRHFAGAQVCHVLSYGSNSTEPLKNPSYADVTLNFPLVANLQKWISSISGWSLISDKYHKIFHRCKYSTSTPTVRAPRMSDIHLWPISASLFLTEYSRGSPCCTSFINSNCTRVKNQQEKEQIRETLASCTVHLLVGQLLHNFCVQSC
jgi:hypothetical protein